MRDREATGMLHAAFGLLLASGGMVSDTIAAPAVSDTSTLVSDTMGPIRPNRTAFIGKPTAPIGISHEFAAEPAVGQPVVITLTVSSGPELEVASLSLAVPEGLVLIEPVATAPLGTIAAGQSREVLVSVLPLTGGTQYLGVTVSGLIGGEPQVRHVSIAIRLPDDAPPQPESQAVGEGDEAVRAFGARETIH